MKANYYSKPMSKTEAHRIAKQEVNAMYNEVFADCAADVMQQTLATVMLCLERDYGWKKQRLDGFVHNLQSWCDIMQKSTEITKAWSTTDNIEYFKKKYLIDLREEFKAEVK